MYAIFINISNIDKYEELFCVIVRWIVSFIWFLDLCYELGCYLFRHQMFGVFSLTHECGSESFTQVCNVMEWKGYGGPRFCKGMEN